MKIIYNNADFSENGVNSELVLLPKQRTYKDVICNFSQPNAVVQSGFSSVFFKIPLSADKIYFSGVIGRVGLAIVDNVVYGENLPTYTNIQQNVIAGSTSDTSYTDEEIDVSQYQGKWLLWSWDNGSVNGLEVKYFF